MRPLLPTGSVTRKPDFTDHRRILQHQPPAELELSIYDGWDERVIDDLDGLPIVTAHAEKTIGATLSGDDPALEDDGEARAVEVEREAPAVAAQRRGGEARFQHRRDRLQ